jgi:hypothetical protein
MISLLRSLNCVELNDQEQIGESNEYNEEQQGESSHGAHHLIYLSDEVGCTFKELHPVEYFYPHEEHARSPDGSDVLPFFFMNSNVLKHIHFNIIGKIDYVYDCRTDIELVPEISNIIQQTILTKLLNFNI